MDSLEKLTTLNRDLLPPFDTAMKLDNGGTARHMLILRREVVANALKELWQELNLHGEPLIFASPARGNLQVEHHPLLLDQLMTNGRRPKKVRPGQLASWKRLDAPQDTGIATTHEAQNLLKSDMLRKAEVSDRHTVFSASHGWFCYTFKSGWTALSAHFYDADTSYFDYDDSVALAAIPPGYQNEWLAFLKALSDRHDAISRRERRGHIEIINGDDDLADVIKKTSFSDVVLPAHTLAQVAAQRRIFDAEMLRRYAALRVPRLRKVLLIGPPGTGKTTLLKAEGALHAKNGGLVLYICPPPKNQDCTSAWQELSFALNNAAKSRLPTLVLVEDFEMFVTDTQELQLVLNTLDGVTTPDNPAGTLLLATSNDPEKIDQRIRDRPGRIDILIEVGLVEDIEHALRFIQHFLGDAYREEEHAPIASLLLKQPGSHFREVCIAGAMHALEMNRAQILREDLLWAHETILNGRALASQVERFSLPSAQKRGRYFGKNR